MVTCHTEKISRIGCKIKVIEISYICLHIVLQNVILVFLVLSFNQKDLLLMEILYTTYYDSNHTFSINYCIVILLLVPVLVFLRSCSCVRLLPHNSMNTYIYNQERWNDHEDRYCGRLPKSPFTPVYLEYCFNFMSRCVFYRG